MTPLTPTEDIRAARHSLAARFDNDLDRIVDDLRRQESESEAEFVIHPGRLPKSTTNIQGLDSAVTETKEHRLRNE